MGPYETYKDGLFGYKVIISPSELLDSIVISILSS